MSAELSEKPQASPTASIALVVWLLLVIGVCSIFYRSVSQYAESAKRIDELETGTKNLNENAQSQLNDAKARIAGLETAANQLEQSAKTQFSNINTLIIEAKSETQKVERRVEQLKQSQAALDIPALITRELDRRQPASLTTRYPFGPTPANQEVAITTTIPFGLAQKIRWTVYNQTNNGNFFLNGMVILDTAVVQYFEHKPKPIFGQVQSADGTMQPLDRWIMVFERGENNMLKVRFRTIPEVKTQAGSVLWLNLDSDHAG